MDKNIFLQKPRALKEGLRIFDRKEAVGFVKEQFMQLVKKNLRLPVKVYHL